MTKKVFDFLSSFGMILVGLSLLFVFSITFYQVTDVKLPQSKARSCWGIDAAINVLPVSHPAVPLAKQQQTILDYPFTATTILVVDDKTDTVLFTKNISESRPLASITKLMSALVLLDLPLKWSTTTIVLPADDLDSSHAIQAGDRLNAQELWKIGLVGSSNSAFNALVRLSGLDQTQFVALMNDKAKKLRLFSLQFADVTGLSRANRGQAKDIIRLFKFALQQEKIVNALQISEYRMNVSGGRKARVIWNTNWLLLGWVPSRFSANSIVGKTGFIQDSGYNFVVRLQDTSARAVRVLILGSASNEARFIEARVAAEWALHNYFWPGDIGYQNLDVR